MTTRRTFLEVMAIGLPLMACKSDVSAQKGGNTQKPIVISTWKDGEGVNKAAWEVLSAQGSALDAVEKGAVYMEDQINCCVGLGGNPDREGKVTLDASIMDHQFNCGAVAFLERIKHPISVARKVMESTPHVFLVGAGAQQFALEQGFSLEEDVLSEKAKEDYEEWLITSEYKPVINIEENAYNHDTMGLLALDATGNLSGACTTSGMAFKMRGRIGDSPIIGSGLYVENEVGAVVATGVGEEVIRTGGSSFVISMMRQGMSPQEACKKAIERIVNVNAERAKEMQVAFIALDKNGNHGAFAIQKEFHYCIKSDVEEVMLESASWF